MGYSPEQTQYTRLHLLSFLMQWSMRMRMLTDDSMVVHFGLILFYRAVADHAVVIIQVLTRPGICGTCSAGQVIRATLSKTHQRT